MNVRIKITLLYFFTNAILEKNILFFHIYKKNIFVSLFLFLISLAYYIIKINRTFLIFIFYSCENKNIDKFIIKILFTILYLFQYYSIWIFLRILGDKLQKMNKIILNQLSSTNEINTKYNMQSHIPCKFIIVMDFYNRDFVQHVLQVTRYDNFTA